MKHIISRSLGILLIIAALTIALPVFSLKLVDDTTPLSAGYWVNGEPDAYASKFCSLLDADGLLSLDSRDELKEQVQDGHLSMGLIIPGDLGTRFSVNEIEGVITLITSRPSSLEILQKTEIMSALYDVLAPHITYSSLAEAGFSYDKDAVFTAYEGMEQAGLLFTFEQMRVDGTAMESAGGSNVFRLVLGIMLWIGMLLGVCMPLCGRVRALAPAIGKRRAWLRIGIPGFVLGYALMSAAAAVSCSIAGFGLLIMPAVICLGLMGLLGLGICLAFPGNQVCTIVCVFLAAFAPVLCPALVDLSLFIPVIEKVRVICPVYWLWM